VNSESGAGSWVRKLLQKSSVSKFVCSIAQYFLLSKFHHFLLTVADVIFEVEIGTIFEIKNYCKVVSKSYENYIINLF
jgi:hypothetical protein